ncbi:MAG: RNA methyltransferase, partial [Clostridia bacterium]|nr:RNA methyltransferase [Clostridia bacterium]
AKLFISSKTRSKNGLFVIEGLRLCFDAMQSGIKIKTAFLTQHCYNKFQKAKDTAEYAEEYYIVTDEVIKNISDTVSPQGIVCVCENIENKFTDKGNLKAVVLCNVADPSNLGTISRTAEAFAVDLLIVSGGCDIYNPKALRASMGALFRLPVLVINQEELFVFLSNNQIKSYATVPNGAKYKINEIAFNKKSAVIIGNEANGITNEVIKKCDYTVTIPMKGRAESLNAASAASISIYEMVRESL